MNKKVRRICRDINSRSDDRQQLEILMIKLQDVLREERYNTRAVQVNSRSENPFDKIMVG
ncbi:MAG: hypothetical protein ABSB14_05540 [Candidatus Sulfotelmatobacter sp.]